MPVLLSEFKGKQLIKLLNADINKKMKVIGISLVNELEAELVKQDDIDGLTPSAPGEAPAKVTGRLSASQTYNIDEQNMTLRAGTPVAYGRDLELGTKNMAARPWLRPVVRKNMARIQEILNEKA
jgi:hypothetical protein